MGMGICYSLSRLDKLLPYQLGKWVLPTRMACVTCSQHLRLENAKCNLYNNIKIIKQEWTAIQDLTRSVFFGFPLSQLFVSLFPGFSIRVGNFRTLMSPKKVTDAARGF